MSEGGKCDLSGWFSVVIQVSLLVLIFIAVKSRPESPSETPLRKTEEKHAPLFLGRPQAAALQRAHPLREHLLLDHPGEALDGRPVRPLLHLHRHRRDARNFHLLLTFIHV